MRINFNAKKTEAQWQNTIDEFWKKLTPLWFDWLQWILVLGVIGFLAEQTRNIILLITYAFSYIALFFYLQGFFFSIEFKGFLRTKSKRVQRIASIVLSGILLIGVWFLLSSLILLVKGKVQ
jgi:hypothetical protein